MNREDAECLAADIAPLLPVGMAVRVVETGEAGWGFAGRRNWHVELMVKSASAWHTLLIRLLEHVQ